MSNLEIFHTNIIPFKQCNIKLTGHLNLQQGMYADIALSSRAKLSGNWWNQAVTTVNEV